MTDENPRVTLQWDVMFCDLHLKRLRPTWPKHAGLAIMGMFNAAAADERIGTEAGGDPKELTSVLGRHRPICCFLAERDPELPVEVVTLALEGRVWGMKTPGDT